MGAFGSAELFFLLKGLQWTVALAATGFLFGIPAALRSRSPASRATATSSAPAPATSRCSRHAAAPAALRGLLRAGAARREARRLDSGRHRLHLHASAYLGEIWRGSIEAVPRGQTEASHALALSYVNRMKDVVLPQAFRISLPATIGFLVQLIKGTSLAAIVGFTELTRAGSIIANQIFQPLFVFGVVGLLYFLICWPLSLYGARLERQFAAAGARTRARRGRSLRERGQRRPS